MCLTVLYQIVEILPYSRAIVYENGKPREISLALLGDDVQVGDFVTLRGKYATKVLAPAEAEMVSFIFDALQRERVFVGT